VENALQLEIPLNAQYIRNLLITAHALHDHIVHFYHLSALDWVDVTRVLEADPKKTARLAEQLSAWPRNSARELAAVKERIKGFVGGGQLGIFSNGYSGHSAMTLSPEVNLLAVSHYLQALEYQRKANQAVAILGGKTPNIQNLAVGGVANAINLDDPNTLDMNRLFTVKNLLQEVLTFIKQVYLVDVCAIGAMYADWLGYGKGITNTLSVPDLPLDGKGTHFDMPGGAIFDGELDRLHPITSFNDPYFVEGVEECITQGDWTRHPYDEQTEPNYTGFNARDKYGWVKAPRFAGRPMQVGPLAQVLAAYAAGDTRTEKWAQYALSLASKIAKTKVGPEALHSTLGRHACRAIRCVVMGELALEHWQKLIDNIGKGDTAIFNKPSFPKGEVRGVGFHEAPRGVLSHWVVIENGTIKNYQCVVPSTWNASPRDDKAVPGPYEASLVGNPIADPEKPLEALRTIHSFDPCLACAIHAFDREGKRVARVKVL
jgi:hydrogenase large subunit